MTTTNAAKKLTKAGFTIKETRPGSYHAYSPSTAYVIEYFRNGCSDSIICICVRRFDDHHDSQTDYSAGMSANTITQAIRLAA